MNVSTVDEKTLTQLGGMSLKKLPDYHRDYLKETYIRNWDRAIDWKYGGFANTLNPAEEPDFENKNMYYQGRALWMFSYLYNHITSEKRHLEAAIRGRDFIKKYALTEDFHWVSTVNRVGQRLSGPNNHYGDIYYFRVSGII